MSYHGFTLPDAAAGQKVTVGFWIDWMQGQGDILIPIAPLHAYSCERCFGAVTYRDDGTTWPICWNCRQYGDAVDTFVPIAYSIDAGMESMLHRFKDRGVPWLRRPLASLLTAFLRGHADCIDNDARAIGVATAVPSNDPTRSFNHIELLLHGVSGGFVFNRFAWSLDAVSRDPSVARPKRGELKPSAYQVNAAEVAGAAVLLLDDTWTSGSSASSTAAALKEAGAEHVTVLTLGRQLNAGNHFGSSDKISDDRHGQEWNPDECVLCS